MAKKSKRKTRQNPDAQLVEHQAQSKAVDQEELDRLDAERETDSLGKIVAIALIIIFGAWIVVISPAIINYFRGYPQ